MKISTTWWGWALGMAVALLAGGSGDTQAATRFWALQNVTLADGGTITGIFGYDNVSHTVSDWNIRMQGGSGQLPFTFVPGDSASSAGDIAISGGGLPADTRISKTEMTGKRIQHSVHRLK